MTSTPKSCHPYRSEILGVIFLSPFLLGLETWRRWGDLLSSHYFDDVGLVVLALIAVWKLHKRTEHAQLLWLFFCGAAVYTMLLSFLASVFQCMRAETDASGVAIEIVVVIKTLVLIFITLVARRSFRLAGLPIYFQKHRQNEDDRLLTQNYS